MYAPFILRLLSPFAVIYYPFWGSILTVLTDTTDVLIWYLLNTPNLSEFYNFADKLLDFYSYIFMGAVSWKFGNRLVRNTAIILLFLRLLGVIFYSLWQLRLLLFIFPNVFLTYFIVYTGIIAYRKKDPITNWKRNLILLTAVTLPKLIQEYLFHVRQINIFQYVISLF